MQIHLLCAQRLQVHDVSDVQIEYPVIFFLGHQDRFHIVSELHVVLLILAVQLRARGFPAIRSARTELAVARLGGIVVVVDLAVFVLKLVVRTGLGRHLIDELPLELLLFGPPRAF
jgi:hypothetical protein